jgi:hypothetical protein
LGVLSEPAPGRAALEEHEAILVLAEGDHVGAHLGVGVFALQFEFRTDGLRLRLRQVGRAAPAGFGAAGALAFGASAAKSEVAKRRARRRNMT